MSSIKIISGKFRGRSIPFKNNEDSEITSQKIKGAVFSMLGENLNGKSFLDLFSGSGQIGIEALSRGASPVIFNERDIKRFKFIDEYLIKIDAKEDSILYSFPARRAIKYLSKREFSIDYIFLDPPYEKDKIDTPLYSDLILRIDKNNILKKDGMLIIQNFHKNKLDSIIGNFKLHSKKKYGSTILNVYKYN